MVRSPIIFPFWIIIHAKVPGCAGHGPASRALYMGHLSWENLSQAQEKQQWVYIRHSRLRQFVDKVLLLLPSSSSKLLSATARDIWSHIVNGKSNMRFCTQSGEHMADIPPQTMEGGGPCSSGVGIDRERWVGTRVYKNCWFYFDLSWRLSLTVPEGRGFQVAIRMFRCVYSPLPQMHKPHRTPHRDCSLCGCTHWTVLLTPAWKSENGEQFNIWNNTN